MSTDATREKNWLLGLLRLAMVLLFIGLVAGSLDFSGEGTSFDRRHLWAFWFIQPFQVMCVWIVALRLWMLIPQPRPPLNETFKAYLLSTGLNNVLPGRLSELIKLTYLGKRQDTTYAGVASAVFLERYADVVLFACLLFLGFGSAWLTTSPLVQGAILAGLVGGLCSIPLWRAPFKWLARLAPTSTSHSFLMTVYDNLCDAVATPRFVWALVFGVVAWAMGFVTVYAGLMLMAPMSWQAALTVYAAIAVGRLIPGLPGGLGTYEASGVLALTHLGYGVGEALTITLTLHVSQSAFPTLAAFGLMTYTRMGVVHTLRELTSSLRKARS
ncbi:MAG: lysylphosphatidylglycerol synthase transmembrane domain-containing protein [Gemmataceae bacterium]